MDLYYNLQRLVSEGLAVFIYTKIVDGKYLGRFLLFDGTDLTTPLPSGASAAPMTIGIGNDNLLVCQDVFDMFGAVEVNGTEEMDAAARSFRSSIDEWRRLGGQYNFPPRPTIHLDLSDE